MTIVTKSKGTTPIISKVPVWIWLDSDQFGKFVGNNWPWMKNHPATTGIVTGSGVGGGALCIIGSLVSSVTDVGL